MIIDTHCHLIDEAFKEDVETVIQNALSADVNKMILACCDEGEYLDIINLCKRHPSYLYPTIGIHPENMKEDVRQQFESLKKLWTPDSGIKAIGEIGIDLHWDQSRLEDQQWLLTAQTEWALDLNLPILLHIRDAMPEFLTQCRDSLYPLASQKKERLRGILHCYSGTAEQAMEALDYGDFFLGVGGTSTYKKSLVPEVVKAVGIDRIVLETDAPYLAPTPYRGKRNEPAYTAITCRFIAEILGLSIEKVAEKTTENACLLFSF